MSLRDSLDLIQAVRPDAGTSALEYEILAERAASLGAAEHRVVTAIAALASAVDDRDACLSEARRTVWEYFVQRELIGFRKHNDVIQELNIPSEVLAGLGAMPASNRR
jgi:hypothetical protein